MNKTFIAWLLAWMVLFASAAFAAPPTPTEDFTDNGDGTVTHRITGLTWMRCAMGMTWTGTSCTGTAATYTWDQATKLTTSFAGKSDWRLPSIAELNTLDNVSPAINSTVFPNTSCSSFWSGSPVANYSSRAWIVEFCYVGDYADDRSDNIVHVRLVRGGQSFDPLALYTPTADFIDNGDGTVTHLKTGLMWKRCAEGQIWTGSTCSGTGKDYDWGTATALTSSSAGYSDWRLPTGNELQTIVEYQKYFSAINITIFPNTLSSHFWSASAHASYSGSAWYVDFYDGYAYRDSKSHSNRVRLVRGGQFFSPLGFAAQTGVVPNFTITSNTLKIAGIGNATPISIVGGSYAINGGAFTTTAGTVNANDSVTVRVATSTRPGTTTRATLTIGTVSGDFSVTTLADSQAPAPPGSLNANSQSSSSGDAHASLTWSAVSDNTSVTSYRIYRNGMLLAVVGNVLSYTDTQLTDATNFKYSVAACDAANNCSALSSAVTATIVGTAKTVPLLAGGASHSAAVKNDGSLLTWGLNESGQLGNGATAGLRSWPQTLGTGFTGMALGGSHSVAIKGDGGLWAWGGNASGQLGDGTTSTRNSPTQIGTGYIAVAAGNAHTLGIKDDGSLWAWGNSGSGQLGDGTANSHNAPTLIGSGFYAVAAGTSHSAALKTDGTLWAWGSNVNGQLGDGTGNDRYAPTLIGSGFTVVAAGAFHTLALKADGSLWAWGHNDAGQLGDGTAQDRYVPTPIGTGFSAISAGTSHTLALKPDGSVWAWGSNASGQLGDGTTTNHSSPQQVPGLSNIIAIAAGGDHSLALAADGTVWAWGENTAGELGDGTLAKRLSSVFVVNETVDGALDLIPDTTATLPADKIPDFFTDVTKDAQVSGSIKFDATAQNKYGSVYGLAYLPADSPLLTGKSAGNALKVAKMVQPQAGGAGLVSAVLTRSGWKQADATTATEPVFTGTLNAAAAGYSLFDVAQFDNTKNPGVFCVGYAAGDGTKSAKGLSRAVVTGLGSTPECPELKVALAVTTTSSTSTTTSTSTTSTSTTTSTVASTTTTTLAAALHANLSVGWNLVGNGVEAPIAVASTFNDANHVMTVWKWVPSGSSAGVSYPAWAFYTPSQQDGGQAYAASKGYAFLTAINAGEGFWVNAKATFTVTLPAGAAVVSSSFKPEVASPASAGGTHALARGWSLIATGDKPVR